MQLILQNLHALAALRKIFGGLESWEKEIFVRPSSKIRLLQDIQRLEGLAPKSLIFVDG